MAKSYTSIYSALAANVVIAFTKFVAGYWTSSSSMISEGIHSLVDSVNQLLILYGLKKSRQPPDKLRPFGYGKELYFWSFIVSILIFGLGGGISIYQGVLHAWHPLPQEDPTWNYVVLVISLLFEGGSFLIAAKEFNLTRKGLSWWEAIVKSKDPTSFLVLFEDGAAVVGLLIVFVLMLVAHSFHLPFLDGIASILVGLLLVVVSAILAKESRSLLMGEGVSIKTQNKIIEKVEQDPSVLKVIHLYSTYQSPEEVLLILAVELKPDLDTEDITQTIDRLRHLIRSEFSVIRYVMIQPQ